MRAGLARRRPLFLNWQDREKVGSQDFALVDDSLASFGYATRDQRFARGVMT